MAARFDILSTGIVDIYAKVGVSDPRYHTV